MPRSAPTASITAAVLRTLAGDRAYERGEAYARAGYVGDIAEDGTLITASVVGTERYRVTLEIVGRKLVCGCTCPAAEDSACCKHAVALGLQWLAERAHADPTTQRRSAARSGARSPREIARPLTMKDVRAHLARQPSAALVELVMQQAMADDRLRQRLLLDAAASATRGSKFQTIRKAITAAIGTGAYVGYHEAGGYFGQVHDLISSLEILNREAPAAVIELTEHALTHLEQAIGHIDDSAGGTSEVLARLHALHLAACTRAKPEPVALADRLFAWEMRSEWEIFSNAASRYADVLGDAGVARYRALADAEWKKMKPLAPGDKERTFSGHRWRITMMMDSLARLTGDVDAVAAVRARDLSNAYAYLQIAELYLQARRADDAVQWAERGVAAFPEKTDPRLRAFLATQYQRRKRGADAMALLWKNFEDRPSLHDYIALHAVATRNAAWTAWRERAIAEVRRSMQPRPVAKARAGVWRPTDASLLVEILLWEGDVDAAWGEASAAGCSETLWLQLAKSRETTHPSDAVTVYQKAVEHTLSRTNNGAYHDAVMQLRVIARVMKLATIAGGFNGYLASLRARHKAKRNFMKLLDGARFHG